MSKIYVSNIKTFVQNIKRECFTFLKIWRNIPKIGQNILLNATRRGIRAVKFFLAHSSNTENICKKFHKIRCGTAVKIREA